jgi:predicted dehydrogenase
MTKQRCLMIGVGGMARHWINNVWHTFSDRMEFAGLVDINQAALDDTADALGLSRANCFTNMAEAFEKVDADFCCIVTPPQFHADAVKLACARGMDILSEKPISDTWDGCVEIYKAVEQSGVKMLVTQNYRYTPRILTLKKAVQSLGAINYAVSRYAADYRKPLAWGAAFRHEMRHSLMVEASVHHFDQLRNLTGGDCVTLSGYEWHPGQIRGDDAKYAGSNSFKGETNGMYVMQFNTGSVGSYEGNNLSTGKQNSWHSEYYRVECEGGAVVLDADHVVRIEERTSDGTLSVREVPTERPKYEGHFAMGAQMLDWLEGGEAPATVVSDNIKSNAMLFAAIEAAATNSVVNVQAMVEAAIKS